MITLSNVNTFAEKLKNSRSIGFFWVKMESLDDARPILEENYSNLLDAGSRDSNRSDHFVMKLNQGFRDLNKSLQIDKHFEMLTPSKATVEAINSLDILVCGKCYLVYHNIDEFQSHGYGCQGVLNHDLEASIDTSTEYGLAQELWVTAVQRQQNIGWNAVQDSSSTIHRKLKAKWFKMSKKSKIAWIQAARSLQCLAQKKKSLFEDLPVIDDDDHFMYDEEDLIEKSDGDIKRELIDEWENLGLEKTVSTLSDSSQSRRKKFSLQETFHRELFKNSQRNILSDQQNKSSRDKEQLVEIATIKVDITGKGASIRESLLRSQIATESGGKPDDISEDSNNSYDEEEIISPEVIEAAVEKNQGDKKPDSSLEEANEDAVDQQESQEEPNQTLDVVVQKVANVEPQHMESAPTTSLENESNVQKHYELQDDEEFSKGAKETGLKTSFKIDQEILKTKTPTPPRKSSRVVKKQTPQSKLDQAFLVKPKFKSSPPPPPKESKLDVNASNKEGPKLTPNTRSRSSSTNKVAQQHNKGQRKTATTKKTIKAIEGPPKSSNKSVTIKNKVLQTSITTTRRSKRKAVAQEDVAKSLPLAKIQKQSSPQRDEEDSDAEKFEDIMDDDDDTDVSSESGEIPALRTTLPINKNDNLIVHSSFPKMVPKGYEMICSKTSDGLKEFRVRKKIEQEVPNEPKSISNPNCHTQIVEIGSNKPVDVPVSNKPAFVKTIILNSSTSIDRSDDDDHVSFSEDDDNAGGEDKSVSPKALVKLTYNPSKEDMEATKAKTMPKVTMKQIDLPPKIVESIQVL